MYCEWPEFRRCCLCLPLRKGILVFAYLNIFFTLFQILTIFLFEIEFVNDVLVRNLAVELPAIFCLVLSFLEIIFSSLLIYGIHKKRPSFVKVYYYFMISYLMASVILAVLDAVQSRHGEWVLSIFCLVINIYLISLVRSLVHKLEVSDGNKFSNQLADFIEGSPVRSAGVYSEIVVSKDCNDV